MQMIVVFCESSQDISRALSEKYKIISEFMSNNKLKLNSDKTHVMVLSSERALNALDMESICLNTGNEVIRCSKSEKLLGGIISRNLKWSDHLLHDCQKG